MHVFLYKLQTFFDKYELITHMFKKEIKKNLMYSGVL